ELSVDDGVVVTPQLFAAAGVQADDSFDLLELLLAVHDVDAIAGYGDAAVAGADGLFPARLEFVGELVGQTLDVPDVVTVLAAPLRPVGGEEGAGESDEAPADGGGHWMNLAGRDGRRDRAECIGDAERRPSCPGRCRRCPW